MAKNTRARVKPFASQTFAANVATNVFSADGANQISLLFEHTEGTSATALSLQVKVFVDVSTTDGGAWASVFSTDAKFPLAEEVLGTVASGVQPVTVYTRKYDFDSNLLNAKLPVITFPISAGPFVVELTWTEAASAAGTIKGLALVDNV